MVNYYDKEGQRKEEYKVDATRGRSLIQPRNYKGDANIQVWMDSRVLATLTIWMEKEGMMPRFMSEVVRDPLTMLTERLVEEGRVRMVEDTGEAREILNRRFRVDLNKGGRGNKNKLHNMVLSGMRVEDNREDASRTKRSRMVVSQEEMDKMLGIMRDLDRQDFEAQKEKDIERLKSEGRLVEETEFDREKREREYVDSLNASPEQQLEFLKKQGKVVEEK